LGTLFAQEDQPSWFYNWVLERTGGNEFLATVLGNIIPDLLRVAIIFAIAWVATRLVRRLIKRLVDRMVHEDTTPFTTLRRAGPLATSQPISPQRAIMRTETVGAVLRSVASLLIWTIAVLVAIGSLDTIEINLGPLIASAGIAGVAIGFGAQSLVKDFLSGMFMLLEDQFGIGDIVNVGEATGVVERISLRKTQLRDIEGTVWHVPNGEITRVGNLSQLWSRSLLDISVAYGTDLRHAMRVMKDVADSVSSDPEWAQLVLEPPEIWGVERFDDSAVAIRMVVKTEPAKQWDVNRELRLRLKEAFDAEDIEIPFPQRSLWFRSVPAQGADAAPEAFALPPREDEPSGARRPETGRPEGSRRDPRDRYRSETRK
jgi:moderate conductance mechanosensitive channel